MKGTSFQKPLEFNLSVEGESWKQGDVLSGVLQVRNHGSDPIATSSLRVHLAHGSLKKVRAKDPEAFSILTSASPDGSAPATLSGGGTTSLPWSFQTDPNAPITDTSGSLFILYGAGEDQAQLGQIQLTFNPAPAIEELFERLRITFRFALKGIKARKGGVEAKFAPPSAGKHASLEALTVTCRFGEEETLESRYVFQTKKIEGTLGGPSIAAAKDEINLEIARARYLLSSGRFDHDVMEASIEEALNQAFTSEAAEESEI